MALLDRLRQELDRAGRQAHAPSTKVGCDSTCYRASNRVDRFAQRFGYAGFRAKKAGRELPAEELTAHMNNLVAAEAEVTRLETLIAEASKWMRTSGCRARAPPPAAEQPGLTALETVEEPHVVGAETVDADGSERCRRVARVDRPGDDAAPAQHARGSPAPDRRAATSATRPGPPRRASIRFHAGQSEPS